MTDLSISEAYFLCAVQNKGKLFGHDTAKVACLMAAVLYEMKQSGIISWNQKKVTLTGALPPEASYLFPVYEHLKEMNLTDFKHILQDYASGWSDRHLNALTTAIGDHLAECRLATKAKVGLFNGRTYFMPYKNAIPALATELQVNIMYQTPVPTEDGFLWILLKKSDCVPKSLEEELQTKISARISDAVRTYPDGKLAEAARFADTLFTVAKANSVFIN